MFKPRIMSSVHASTESIDRHDMTHSLATNVKDAFESEVDAAKLTQMNAVVNPRSTTPNSKNL